MRNAQGGLTNGESQPMTWWLPLGSSPAYSELPWVAGSARLVSLTVRGDAAAITAGVPSPLVSTGAGLAHVWALDLASHAGAAGYLECLMAVPAEFQGEPGFYPVWSYVDSDVSLMLGREITGVPKKIARLELARKDDQIVFSAERGGVELLRGGMLLQEEVSNEGIERLNGRMSGSVWTILEAYTPDAVAQAPRRQLLQERSARTVRRAIRGKGFLTCTGSASDPVDQFGRLEVLRGTYMEYSSVLHAPVGRGVFEVAEQRLFRPNRVR